MAGKYLLQTLGCKVNQYESQELRQFLSELGLRAAQTDEEPDVAIVNTCAVTTAAVRKNRQCIRRLSRRGAVPVIVVGCGASAEGARLAAMPGVAAVLGHDADVPSTLRRVLHERLGATSPAGGRDDGARSHTVLSDRSILSVELPVVKNDSTLVGRIDSFEGHQRAFIKIQDGCDAHCTYCIIPRLRSTLRSKPIEAVVAEAHGLVRNGYREVILTGIFLGAYGRETAIRRRFTRKGSPLAALLRRLVRIEGLERIRLSSLEPGDMDLELLDAIASNPRCVPHLHLPLQSGSESILRRMNRQYSREDFINMIDRVRATLDRPAISTDVIVGFPGEADSDFEASCEVARRAEFCKIHAFPFSPRPGTAAARWSRDFVPASVVHERMQRLSEIERAQSFAFRKRLAGAIERVIVEKRGSRIQARLGEAGACLRHGRADRYFEIHFDADESIGTGDLVHVRIERVTPTRTHGTMVDPRATGLSLPVLGQWVSIGGPHRHATCNEHLRDPRGEPRWVNAARGANR